MSLENGMPDAVALLYGNATHPELFGRGSFFQTPMGGLLVNVEVYGLPENAGFLGLHLHEVGDCTLPFDKTGAHYNPGNMPHPQHAGDMPPLLNNRGYAFLAFYTDRLKLRDVFGKSMIIHSQRDDFTSQPSGDAGEKIACGVIHRP